MTQGILIGSHTNFKNSGMFMRSDNVILISDRFHGVVCKMPNIFKCLEADVLGGRLGSEKWVQADFTYAKFYEVGKS